MTPLRLLAPLALVIALLPACKGEDASGTTDTAVNQAEPGKAPAPEAEASGAAVVDTAAPGDAATAAAADDGDADAPLGEAGEPPGPGEDDEADAGEEAEPLAPVPDSFETIGVALCDQYVADHLACVAEKVPEAEREAQRRAVFDNVSVWKQTAARGEAAEKGLQTACRIAREQAKRATQEWGCAW